MNGCLFWGLVHYVMCYELVREEFVSERASNVGGKLSKYDRKYVPTTHFDDFHFAETKNLGAG